MINQHQIKIDGFEGPNWEKAQWSSKSKPKKKSAKVLSLTISSKREFNKRCKNCQERFFTIFEGQFFISCLKDVMKVFLYVYHITC